MKAGLGIAALALLAACASTPEVAPLGPETFTVSRQAATGFTGIGSLKAQTLQVAAAHCASLHKQVKVTQVTEAQPPFVMGNFPRVDVTFMCLAAGDPRLTQP